MKSLPGGSQPVRSLPEGCFLSGCVILAPLWEAVMILETRGRSGFMSHPPRGGRPQPSSPRGAAVWVSRPQCAQADRPRLAQRASQTSLSRLQGLCPE